MSDETSDSDKLRAAKKRKIRRAAKHAFALVLCLFAASLVVTSLLLATGRLGWGSSGLERIPVAEENSQPDYQEPESDSSADDTDIGDTASENAAQTLPDEVLEITPVVSVDNSISGMKEIIAEDPVTFVPDALYCTIWPVKDLKAYSDISCTSQTGTAKACSMYCVLEENAEAGLFLVRTGRGETGWIDSRYCMINLPEYLGDLCSYNITNSFSSAYTIHEYEIPGLTGKVITGYENVRLADGSFLVPFLYPCCKKLVNAAKQAYGAGYRIKIYDSYRPKVATNSIYYTAIGVIDSPLPDNTVTGSSVTLPKPTASGSGYQRDYLIYRDLIEMNGWDLSSFLAPGASRHNMGVALDMTFEDAETKEEVSAQSLMHDLSAYSTIRSNNQIAAKIYKLMEGCKMHNIVSEWWHFQDNEAMNSLKPPYCEKGVSAEGWIADSRGERFRLADGTVLKSCMMVTNDETLYFDAEGYLVSED